MLSSRCGIQGGEVAGAGLARPVALAGAWCATAVVALAAAAPEAALSGDGAVETAAAERLASLHVVADEVGRQDPEDGGWTPRYAILRVDVPGEWAVILEDINADGEIALHSMGRRREQVRYLVNDGLNQRELELPSGLNPYLSWIRLINDSGFVVLESGDIKSGWGYWTPDGGFHEVELPEPERFGWLTDMNNDGVMCGDFTGINLLERAYRIKKGIAVALPNLYRARDAYSKAQAMTEYGGVIGISGRSTEDLSVRAVRWGDGDLEVLPFEDGIPNLLHDINGAGVIVGEALQFGNKRFRLPVIWEPGREGRVLPHPYLLNQAGWDVWAEAVTEDNVIFGCEKNETRGHFRYIYWATPEASPRSVEQLLPPKLVWMDWTPQNHFIRNYSSNGLMVGWGEHRTLTDQESFVLAPVRPTLTLYKLDPGRAGELNTIRIEGAPPNAEIHIVASESGGGALITGCRIVDNLLQIENPTPVATVTADANGDAEVNGRLSSLFEGRYLLFQAFVNETCEVSNLVVQQFE